MNKEELIEKIKQLPDLTNEEKSELIGGLRKKKYGLVWENHPEDVEERLRTQLPVLVEDKSKQITSEAEDAPNHILIEGDNLEALTALTYTHEGKIDVIYIDPPYNTGNKDFVYNDSFVDSEDGYRHSKWLSFMEKRLKIAKKLLSDRGVIFISIDDNEQANLKLLCDKVFGENRLLANIITVANPGGRDYKQIAVMHEYLLAYSNTEEASLNELAKEVVFELFDNSGGYELRELRNRNPKFHSGNRPNLFYPFYVNPNTKDKYGCCSVSLFQDENHYIEVKPYNSAGKESVWRWGIPKSTENIKTSIEDSHIVAKEKKSGGWNIYEKCRKSTSKAKSLWDETEMRTEEGTRLMMSIFDKNVFDHPKSIQLLKRCLMLGTPEEALILDFFAGSGTTLHATMQLNAEDGGHRQCILVTNNENNICEEVTYERNKRVINGYTTPKGEKVEGLHNNNLRYYKMDFVPRDNSLEGMRKLMKASTDLLCIKHDLYHEEQTFGSLNLKPHIARYFKEGDKQVLIIYKVDAIEYFVREIAQMGEGTNILVYVFSTNNYAMDADFEEVADKVTLCALPAAIYNAYLKVLPKKKVLAEIENEKEELSLFNGEEEEQ